MNESVWVPSDNVSLSETMYLFFSRSMSKNCFKNTKVFAFAIILVFGYFSRNGFMLPEWSGSICWMIR